MIGNNKDNRYAFNIEIYDNEQKKEVISDGYTVDKPEVIIDILKQVIEKLKQWEKYD